MPSRRPHQKTRHGCARCKARRVKCDEQRPQCGNCLRHGSPCDFQDLAQTPLTISDTSAIGQGAGPSLNGNGGCLHTPSTKLHTIPHSLWSSIEEPLQSHDSAVSTSSEAGKLLSAIDWLAILAEWTNNLHQLPLPTIPDLNPHDLGIFYHYANYTSASLSDNSAVQSTWRVAVSKEALPHDFLMHALLSFASAHLAQIRPGYSQLYGRSAVAHRNLALRSSIPHLRNVTPTNCHALFVFSSIVAISTFSLSDSASIGSASPIEDVATFIVMIQGVHTVLHSGFEWIKMGGLKLLCQTERVDWRQKVLPLPASLAAPIQRLHWLNSTYSKGAKRKIYAAAIANLESFYGAYTLVASDRSLVFIWCAIVPDDFVSSLRKQEPMALVIVAHWAILLHSVSAQWWAGDRGRRLVEVIHRELDEEWKPAIQWPMDVVQGPWSPELAQVSMLSPSK